MRNLLQLLGVAHLSMWAHLCVAQTPDALAASLVTAPAIPAAAVGWVDATGMEFAVAGQRVEGGAAATPQDRWHLGSITKSMTALLAARLVAAGQIAWDDRIGGSDGPTLAELLRHISGLPPNPPAMRMAFLSRDWSADQGETRQLLIRAALDRRSAGGDVLYSNLGYIAAGQMLADAAGVSWEQVLAAELFAPLALTSAGLGAPPEIWGHNADLQPQEPGPFADNPPVYAPAGGVHMAPEDILSYLRLHLLRDPAYLPEEAWAMLHQPLEGADFAMGWQRRTDGSLWHNGSNTLWYAEVVVDHARGRAAFVVVNSGDLATVARPVAAALDAALTR